MQITEWLQTPTEQVVTIDRGIPPLLTVRYPLATPILVIRDELLALDVQTHETTRITKNEGDVKLLGRGGE